VPRFATSLKSMAQNTPGKTSTRSDASRYSKYARANATFQTNKKTTHDP